MKIIKRIKKYLGFSGSRIKRKKIIDFINKFDMEKVSEIHIYPEDMEIIVQEHEL